ncbi:hypothetical protein [Acuticoccus sediminis]|uniref:hypothetical protein n=1 Tax=Acuticoccus sediminis TaxID=2184697 RepID=UPI001390CC59|nr:hypothetical protein [Acuticoccus sediminis]
MSYKSVLLAAMIGHATALLLAAIVVLVTLTMAEADALPLGVTAVAAETGTGRADAGYPVTQADDVKDGDDAAYGDRDGTSGAGDAGEDDVVNLDDDRVCVRKKWREWSQSRQRWFFKYGLVCSEQTTN